MTWLAIVNPSAGAFRNKTFRTKWLPQIERVVTTVEYTVEPRHATILARQAKNYEGIAVVGGDGTVCEVVAGIDRNRQRLAVIPAGRGNSLARTLNVDAMAMAIASLSGEQSLTIDLMEFDARFSDGSLMRGLCASTLAIGYVVSVAQRAARFSRFGHSAYVMATPLVNPVAFPITMEVGHAPPLCRETTGVVINNTTYLANFRGFPQASLTDGLLDVMVLNAGWLPQNFHNLSILTKRGFYEPTRPQTADRVRVVLSRPSPLLVDGEVYDEVVELKVNCLAKAIRCQGSTIE